MRRVILLAVLIAGSSTAAFAGGVPERVWEALGSSQEEYEFEGETHNALEVITEAANSGVDFSEPARVRPNRFERTPYEYMIERTLRLRYSQYDDENYEEFLRHFEERLPIFVERFVRMYTLLPEEKNEYIHSRSLVRELGPSPRRKVDLNFVRYLADMDTTEAITHSDIRWIQTLRDDPKAIDAILESWGLTEAQVKDEPYEVRAIAGALGLTDVSLSDAVRETGVSSEATLSAAAMALDDWLTGPVEDSEEIDAFVATWIEETGFRDVPWSHASEYTSTFVGRAFSEMKPEHLRHLLELGLRQDGASLSNSFAFWDEPRANLKGNMAQLYGWFTELAEGHDPSDYFDHNLTARDLRAARGVVQTILQYEFDLDDGYDYSAYNALHHAAYVGDREIVHMLVDAGVDPRGKDNWGNYPVDIARKQGFTDVVEYLDPLTYGGEVRVVEREVPAESTDENPPRIRLNPLDRRRGLAVAEEDRYDGRTTLSSIAIGGIVVDEGDIETITVSEAETTFNNLGEFEHRVPLQIGENRIAVVAEDEAGNRATETVVVLREEARTLADELGIAGSYYALIIGNEAYSDMPELLTPHEDANRLERILSGTYGFETEVLLDASRSDILDAINHYARLLEPEDRFILYYAGHGYFDETADLAYWLPVDASTETDTNWILSNRITGSLRRMEAQHVAVIADSCYSGTLTRDASIDLTSSDRTTTEYLRRMVERSSRTLLASGGNEPVADGGGGNHSVFAGYLLNALESTDQEVFSLEDLFHNEIRVQVTGNSLQTPEYNTIRNSGHEGGDFVFVRE